MRKRTSQDHVYSKPTMGRLTGLECIAFLQWALPHLHIHLKKPLSSERAIRDAACFFLCIEHSGQLASSVR
jgi:hypothetical protein